MSHESLPLDEVALRARWMVGSFKQEDIDRVLMCPTQGFEPLVSVIFGSLKSFSFQKEEKDAAKKHQVRKTLSRRR
jgi:hypothetical protein